MKYFGRQTSKTDNLLLGKGGGNEITRSGIPVAMATNRQSQTIFPVSKHYYSQQNEFPDLLSQKIRYRKNNFRNSDASQERVLGSILSVSDHKTDWVAQCAPMQYESGDLKPSDSAPLLFWAWIGWLKVLHRNVAQLLFPPQTGKCIGWFNVPRQNETGDTRNHLTVQCLTAPSVSDQLVQYTPT